MKSSYSAYPRRNFDLSSPYRGYYGTSKQNTFNPINTSVSVLSKDDLTSNLLTEEKDSLSRSNKILLKSHLELKNQVKQYEKYNTENNLTQDNINELKEYSEKLKKELASSTKKESELMQNYDEIEKRIDEVNIKNKELQSELNAVVDEYNNQKKENKDIELKYQSILKQYNTEYKDKQNQIKELKQQNEKIFNSNKAIEKSNEDLKSQLSKYESLMNNLQITIGELSNQKVNEKYRAEIEKRIEEKKEELSKKEDYINELLNQNEQLKKDNEDKLNQMKSLQEDIKEKENSYQSINQMKNDLEAYSTKIKKLYEISSTKDQTIKQLQQSYNILFNAVHQDEEQDTDYDAEYIQEKEKNEILVKNIEELNQIAKGLVESQDKMKASYEDVIEKMKTSLKNFDDLSQEKEKMIKENEALRAQNNLIEEKLSQIPKYQKSFDEIRKENAELLELNTKLKEASSIPSEEIQPSLEKKNLNSLFFTLFQNKFLGYDVLEKKYYFAPEPEGYDNFIVDYLPNADGTIVSGILEGLFIVTGNEHNLLYYFSQKDPSVSKLKTFKYNHKYGALLMLPNTEGLLILSGTSNNQCEVINFSQNSLVDFPSLKHQRANAGYCFIGNNLFAFYGYDYKTNSYVNSIEYIDFEKGTEWNEILTKDTSMELKSHSCLFVNSNEIVIVGGVKGQSEEGNKNMMVYYVKEKRIEESEFAIPFIDIVGSYKFEKCKQFCLVLDKKEEEDIPMMITMDDMGNVHTFGKEFEYNVELFKTK